VHLPVALLNQLDPAPFTWQVPGLRTELATELVRSLPKSLRRNLVPAAEYAERALDWLAGHPPDPGEPLPVALGRALRALTGELVEAGDFDLDAVPDHLRITFAVYPDDRPDGAPLATGKDLVPLRRALAAELSRALAAAAPALARTGATSWEFGDIPKQVRVAGDSHPVVGFPALVDEGSTVGLAVLESPQRQRTSQQAGLRRLVLLNTPDPTKWVVSHLGMTEKLALGSSPYAGVPALLADARLASVGELIRRQSGGAEVRSEAAFSALCDAVRAENPRRMQGIVGLAATIVPAYGSVMSDLPRVRAISTAAADDLAEQLGNLVFAGFLSATGYDHLVDLPRYLQAARSRLDTLLSHPARDQASLEIVLRCEDAYAELCEQAPPGPLPDFVAEIGWQIEELRVSLFAQPLRTRIPVSEKRIMAAVAAARARLDQALGDRGHR
jgi:ATP-dependent helicase HrpA